MAFENLKKDGIKYLLGKLKTVFLQIKDAVKSVNGVEADSEGNITITTVPYAQNLESETGQTSFATFTHRTSGGEASIQDGDAWLMKVQGNNYHDGYVAESINMTVDSYNITATIDRDTFVGYVENSGTTVLTYTSDWDADPASYGITVAGTPENGDTITVVYVKEVRGTIYTADPQKMISTGWNLYSNADGYARVYKYSDIYGFRVEGTYTKLQYSATLSGTKTDIAVVDGNFDISADGYVWVTGGNATDTVIYMTWSDWTEEANGGVYAGYVQYEVDLTTIMTNYFPYGLLSAGGVRDEIDLNLGAAINRVERIAYTSENLATAKASGRAYEYDENYIYIAKATPTITSVTIDGSYTVSDHGYEYFTNTAADVVGQFLYGNNLKNKIERDVLTISAQSLTAAQKAQVLSNIGAASPASVEAVKVKMYYGIVTTGTISGNSDANVVIPANGRPSSYNQLLGLFYYGYVPRSAWGTQLFCYGADVNTHKLSFRCQGTTSQIYDIRYVYIYT